jgi:hypothetical protein
MSLPLQGFTIVAIEQAVAAPLATRNLADLGARVIKVERIDGGDFARGYDHVVHGTGAHFVWLNRGKESIAVDLKSAEGVRSCDASSTVPTSSSRTSHPGQRTVWALAQTNCGRSGPNSSRSGYPDSGSAASSNTARPTTC